MIEMSLQIGRWFGSTVIQCCPDPVHLNSLYWRPQNRTEEFWTLKELPGKRRPDVGLYILTSSRTFSGAEEVTYNMKSRKRAIILGETTGGGAHPVSLRPVDDNIVISIPVGRAINPVTQSNWEGTGVEPDVQIPESEALIEAHILALKSIKGRPSDRQSQSRIMSLIRDLESSKKKEN
jgi:C-terminal processing protease CtpA/Prc